VAWPISPSAWLLQAAHIAAEGFYADPSNGSNTERASWTMVGFRRTVERPLVQENLLLPSSTLVGNAAPTIGAAEQSSAAVSLTANAPASTWSAPKEPTRSSKASGAREEKFDVVIVGAGAGGGAVACTLSEAGLRVLVIERGRDLGCDDVHRDHVRSQRLSQYGHNAGPDASHPRVVALANGERRTVLPWQGGYSNNAGCVGGGTRVYGAQAWRFMPQDFRMASLYGVPEGSSLTDWPISYDDLAPWYERAEKALGVCGDGAAMHRLHAPRAAAYPLPPLGPLRRTPVLQGAADSLGWGTFPVPLAIASRDYEGRQACARCTECVGFACPTGAKAGSHNTFLPRALASGCVLVADAMAAQIDVDSRGQACGVTFFAREGASSTWERRSVRAKVVVVAAGAVESARLLLMSRSSHHPRGLGNEHDIVGRNLQGHYYTAAFGVHPDEVYENVGPGPSISTNRWSHSPEARSEGIIGGGMLADDFLKPPIDFWKAALPPSLRRWGHENKAWMQRNYKRTMQVTGPIHEIPSPEGRVQLDAQVRDAWGLPVAHLSGTTHPESLRTTNFLRRRAEQWLRAAGCEQVWSYEPSLYLSGGQHQAGTCRMGEDATSSVCDAWGRVHGQEGLWVLDGSLHPTNGGFNPFLTITSLALRGADKIASSF
jgi:choline dehydrogenase-like flavoprotein